jgi:hypothetical protein
MLGEHIEHAFQALAINEMRVDFDCNKWIQSEAGRDKGQILKQVREHIPWKLFHSWLTILNAVLVYW